MDYETLGVEGNMGLVHKVAHNMRPILCHSGLLQYEDLVSEGVLGLMWALERFDSKKGYKFSSYAASCIRFFMYRGHRNLFKGRWKAQEAGIKTFTRSLFLKDTLEHILGIGDRGMSAATTIHRIQRKMFWREILGLLPPLQKEVISLILDEMSQADIARHLGITRQAVGMRYMKAVERAKAHLHQEAT